MLWYIPVAKEIQIRISFKEMIQKASQGYEPVLHAVSVEAFSECVLVIEDVVREYIERKK